MFFRPYRPGRVARQMADLSKIQRDFVVAAHAASVRQGRVFCASRVCEWLRIADQVCTELFAWGEKQGLLRLLPNDEAILTDAGMALGARLGQSGNA